MKNKLRLLSAFCAIVISTSIITPAYALPEGDINFLGERFQIAKTHLNIAKKQFDDRNNYGEFYELKNELKGKNDYFYSRRNFLLNSYNDEAHTDFLNFHNTIDNVFNSISLNNIKSDSDYSKLGFNDSSLETTKNKMNTFCVAIFKNSFNGQRCVNLNERLRQLKVRIFYYYKNAYKYLIGDDTKFKWEIIDKFNSLSLDINASTFSDFEKDMCNFNSRIDQLHRVIDKFNMSTKIEDGIYTIESKLDNNKCLDIQYASKDDCANLQLFEKNSTEAQKFKVVYNKEAGYCTLVPMCSKKPLDVALAGKDWGTNIQQYSYNDNDAQKWYIVPDGQGCYSIVSKSNNLCVDVSNANTANGTNIQCWGINGTDAQKFKLVKS